MPISENTHFDVINGEISRDTKNHCHVVKPWSEIPNKVDQSVILH